MSNTNYENIDVDIRNLVFLINSFKGIRTIFSCSGHKLGEQGYISFTVETLEVLQKLLLALPKSWCQSGFSDNRPYFKQFWINASIMPEFGLVYTLRFEGSPFYMQRELSKEIEDSLNRVLSDNKDNKIKATQ